ncbi:hypothetical protein MMC16_007699 [Acarospora aff. strigata]|nr:hypothetical protein [Acarospora aff. strigata]
MCLERLTDRFGASNERLMSLRGLYREAVAEDDSALTDILKDYEDVLKEALANTPIAKRRITLLRTMSRPQDAVAAIVTLLDTSPTDAEAWFELSDLYSSLGLYSQAIYSLEEVLLITPNAWNVHTRLGEILFLSASVATSANAGTPEVVLVDAMRRFCRSIELCDSHLRGYYGLQLTTDRLLRSVSYTSSTAPSAASDVSGETNLPSRTKVQKLHELATSKLADIVTHFSAGDANWQGYEQSEIIAARQLLDSDISFIKR